MFDIEQNRERIFIIHFSSKKAKELVEKWQKCLRRIPLRPKSASDHPNLKSDHSESNSNTPEAEESFSSKRRRSPRLAPVKEEMTEEEIRAREERREERRRKFEEQVTRVPNRGLYRHLPDSFRVI